MKLDGIDDIKELIRVVLETGIGELEVRIGENLVRIRGSVTPVSQDIVLSAAAPVSGQVVQAGSAYTAPTAAAETPNYSEDERVTTVKSPIVGTYYDAPAPGAASFVKVGDHVEPKQVLCIIESMKLMNEIEAEAAGIIVAKLVENGHPVEYGQSLFTIRPA